MYLVEASDDVNARNNEVKTALALAKDGSSNNIIKFLKKSRYQRIRGLANEI